MKRRDFLRMSAFFAGAATFHSFPYHAYASSKHKYITDKVKLGNTGIELTRMAMGTGTGGVGGSSKQTRRLGIKGLGDLLHAAYDKGVMFWDSADQYGSHPHMKEALKFVPREDIVILTKTHATTEKEMKADLDRFRKEIGTDYIDIMLLHCMISADWPTIKRGAMNVLSEAREDGIIKAHGVSCHSLSALKAAADEEWVQVDLARTNPAGVRMDADVPTVEAVLKDMKSKGKGIIGMKVFGAGRLSNNPDECLQYVVNQDFIDCFTIGVEGYEQFQDLEKRVPQASVRG